MVTKTQMQMKHAGDFFNYPDSNFYRALNKKPPKKYDYDGDYIVNWEDCNPYDSEQQGIIGKIRHILGLEPKPKELPKAPEGMSYVGTTSGKTVLVSNAFAGPTSSSTKTTSTGGSSGGSRTSSSSNMQVGQSSSVVSGTSQASTVSAYKMPTVSERVASIPSYVRANIKHDVPGTIKGTAQIIGGAATTASEQAYNKIKEKLTGTTEEEKNNAIEQERRKLQTGTREESFTKSGRGTVMQTSKPYTDEEIRKGVEAGNINEKAGFNELQRRENERYGREYTAQRDAYIKEQLPNIEETSQAKLNAYRDSLQEQVNKRGITADYANKLLIEKTNKINEDIGNQVEAKAKEFHKIRGVALQKNSEVYLEQLNDKFTKAKIIRTAPQVAVATYATGGLIGASTIASGIAGSTAVTAIGAGAFGLASVKTGTEIYEAKQRGTLSATKIFNAVAPTLIIAGTGYAGFKAGAAVRSAEITEAVNNAYVVSKTPKEITTEKQIWKLEGIDDNGKAILSEQLRSGNSVAIREYEIVNPIKSQQKIINKNLPVRKITSYEVTNTKNDLIWKQSLIKVEISRGRFNYVDYETGLSKGYYNPETDITELRTLRISGTPENTKQIAMTKELIKSNTEYVSDEFGNIIGRKIKSTVKTYPGEQTAIKKRITEADLKKLGTGKFAEIPDRTIESKAYQELKNIEQQIKTMTESNKAFSRSITQAEQDLTFKTTENIGISSPLSTSSKPFPKNPPKPIYPQASNLNGLNLKLKTKTVQMPSIDFSKEITNEIITATKIQAKQAPSILKPSSLEKTKSTFKAATTPAVTPKIKVKEIEKELNKERNALGLALGRAAIETRAVSPVQNIKLNSGEKLLQKQIEMSINPVKIPRINLITPTPKPYIQMPPLPLLFPKLPKQKTTNKKLKTKIKKDEAYAASLIAAAVQAKPFKVTKKQYEKLKKNIYSGFETRPVLEIEEPKKKGRPRKVIF